MVATFDRLKGEFQHPDMVQRALFQMSDTALNMLFSGSEAEAVQRLRVYDKGELASTLTGLVCEPQPSVASGLPRPEAAINRTHRCPFSICCMLATGIRLHRLSGLPCAAVFLSPLSSCQGHCPSIVRWIFPPE
jgi:hypothetical protein